MSICYANAISNKLFIGSILFLGMLMLGIQSVQSIGICNGVLGNNLPPPSQTIALYKSNGVHKMRLYFADHATLDALRGSNIELILDVGNEHLHSFASDASSAKQWVQNNVVRYVPHVKFKYIAVGNEVQDNYATLYNAMRHIQMAIVSAGLQGQIKVSTAVHSAILDNTYPPSHAVFKGNAKPYITQIVRLLAENGAPLLVNVYPYFSYIYSNGAVSLPYALFTSPGVVVRDGNFGYQNLFDALLDSFYYALEKEGGANVNVVVSESGWPSQGGVGASVANAGTYYRNLINHVKVGSPKKRGLIETYLFAMYDENAKNGAESERHFGLFNPTTKQPKYQINFT